MAAHKPVWLALPAESALGAFTLAVLPLTQRFASGGLTCAILLSSASTERTLALLLEMISALGLLILRLVVAYSLLRQHRGQAGWQPPVAGLSPLSALSAKLRSPPPDAEYRVVVQTAPWATEVPGWVPAELRPLKVREKHCLSAWAYGNITAHFRLPSS